MIKILLKFFIILSCIGLILSSTLHIFSLFNLVPFGPWVMNVGFGIFIVGLPTVLSASGIITKYSKKEFFKVISRVCPKWLRIVGYSCWFYIFLNIIICLLFGVEIVSRYKFGDPLTPAILRSFSAGYMGFYAVSLMILVTTLREFYTEIVYKSY